MHVWPFNFRVSVCVCVPPYLEQSGLQHHFYQNENNKKKNVTEFPARLGAMFPCKLDFSASSGTGVLIRIVAVMNVVQVFCAICT